MKKLLYGLLIGFWATSALAQTQLGNPATGFGHFRPNIGGTQVIAATTTSASVTLTATDNQNSELRIYNNGAAMAFCRWGIGAQTAVTATDVPIAPGATQDFTKGVIIPGQGQTQVVACLMGTGTGNIYVVTGVSGQ